LTRLTGERRKVVLTPVLNSYQVKHNQLEREPSGNFLSPVGAYVSKERSV